MKRSEYEKYLRSCIWQGKRRTALKAASHACQLCNSNDELHVHHRTYERVGGKELPSDLTVLCRVCHEHFHRQLPVAAQQKQLKKEAKKRREQLQRRLAHPEQPKRDRRKAKSRSRSNKSRAQHLRKIGHTL